ncbi:putative inorganic phosphate transporter 1-7-like protein [Trifolium pratense]|uniref:Putative inorganic phosphate transporter 1-7-like protein n=1 Tax=Trifolium pratense TaxID=57577 RepID=A0A2K3PA67_TRIPR|nr:putative inorganic phosphate transporter 1-7-like protein [Trifolium pratense]
MSEYSNKKTRGAFIAAIFAMQGFGILAGVAKNTAQAAADMSKVLQVEIQAEPEQEKAKSYGLFSKEFLHRHGLHIYLKDIFSAVGWIPPAQTMNAIEEVYKIARAQTLITLCSTVPGYRGDFPARFWCTCHGISSASGKLGAMVGVFGFLYLAQNMDKTKTDAGYPAGIGVKNSLLLLGVVNILGFLFTFLVPEANGKSLEEMSGENEEEAETSRELEQSHSYNNRTVHLLRHFSFNSNNQFSLTTVF